MLDASTQTCTFVGPVFPDKTYFTRDGTGFAHRGPLLLPNRLWINHIHRLAAGTSEQLLNRRRVHGFITAALGVTQVRRAERVFHSQQWMIRTRQA